MQPLALFERHEVGERGQERSGQRVDQLDEALDGLEREREIAQLGRREEFAENDLAEVLARDERDARTEQRHAVGEDGVHQRPALPIRRACFLRIARRPAATGPARSAAAVPSRAAPSD